MATAIIAVSADSGLVGAGEIVSTSLVPSERKLSRRSPLRVGDGRSQSRISVLDPVSDDRVLSQVEALASAYVSNSDVGLSERLDVAGQYWFYATMLTSNHYPTINVWA